MLPSLVRLATTSSAPLPVAIAKASAQLIPPIPLYRRLLRMHRSLIPAARYMGDSYVKSEFRLTRSTDNPVHIIGFLSQWKQYLEVLEEGLASERGTETGSGPPAMEGKGGLFGRKLDVEAFEKLSHEQVGQLYELMHATKEVWKSPEDLEKVAVSEERREGDENVKGWE